MEVIKEYFEEITNAVESKQNNLESEENRGDEEVEYSNTKEELTTYIEDADRSFAKKTELLHRNNNAVSLRPCASEIANRDSSVKKNSGFIKKLRNLSAAQADSLLKECQTLNLSKYLSEAALAFVEARIKFIDIPSATLLCTELNCSYADFADFLQEEYIKVLSIDKNEPVTNMNRLRIYLCFYAELSLCGIIPARKSLPVLGTALTALTSDKTFNTMNLIISFCKHCGADYAGLVPRRIRMMCEQFGQSLPNYNLLKPSKQESVKNLLNTFYLSLCLHLRKEQERLSNYENKSRQIVMAKGDVHPDRINKAEVMRTEIQSLLSGAVTLAEILDVELPDLPDIDLQDLLPGDWEDCGGGKIWEDEAARLFYTEFPDVKEYLTQMQEQDEDKEFGLMKVADDTESLSKKTALDTFLNLLPECRTKVKIDNAALEFLIYFNNKTGRKKLTTKMLTLPRTQLELLPFYGRFLAILNLVTPDVPTNLCKLLKSEMLRHIHKKDQINVDSKRKTVKFIGELVNFGMYSRKEALRILKMLLFDFTHHNIDMACGILETCGCLLYGSRDTHLSTKYYLEQMMRIKTMMSLEARYVNLVESTYYHVLPPETVLIPPAPQLTTMQMFILNSVYQELMQPGSDSRVLNHLRSLDWTCDETAQFAIHCLTDASRLGYQRIRALANLVAKLADYQEDEVFRIVDGVLEDIRFGMEINDVLFSQKRVAMITYLGELYNYRLLETSDILRVLYSLISFAVGPGSVLDPPSSLIRIHLVLLLLETCALPLSSSDTLTKLNYFFVYLQHYYWVKKSSCIWTHHQPFPRNIVQQFEDILYSICPDFKVANNLEEATNAVTDMTSKIITDHGNILDLSSILGTVYEESEFSEEDESNKFAGESQLENKPAHTKSIATNDELDEDFLKELDKLISDGVKGTDNNIKTNTDIAVPLGYKKAIEDDKPQFVLLMKKGNKQTFKTVTLSPDHEFFVGLKTAEKECRQEKETLKRLTLHRSDLLQEEV